ncbi:MAG: hypothetical protein ACI4NA_04970 [Succinivibrio sp.]
MASEHEKNVQIPPHAPKARRTAACGRKRRRGAAASRKICSTKAVLDCLLAAVSRQKALKFPNDGILAWGDPDLAR